MSQVVNIVTSVVDLLPEDAYIDDLPTSPSLVSPKDSSDSLPTELFASGSSEYPGSQVVTELLHTERKYVQDLETMQVRLRLFRIQDHPSHLFRLKALCNRCCAIKHNRSGHYPSTVPWPEQALELPAEIPYQTGEHMGVALE